MAIVQISRITHRKGLQDNLPQLAGAELGWSVDSRRLFIGNGTLEEGAPVVGNTEILTEYSDILNFTTNYTYKGEAAGYAAQTGPTVGSPISVSIQSWFDQWASVLDFGATGDGVTDDTAAIQRAIYQLYCREVNPQIRRALFFPAGVYLVSGTINIPPYATLYGEGPENSIIQLGTSASYVIRTSDSLDQTGANIGTNNAIPPRDITVRDMGFQNLISNTDILLVEDAQDCSFINTSFIGPLTTADLTTASNDTSCVRFSSTPSLVTQGIKFNQCTFTGTVYGFNTDEQVQAITVMESKFKTLYQGVVLGTGTVISGGATGFKVSHSSFDQIYAEGIIFGEVTLNVSDYNTFYDVGNEFGGLTNPQFTIVDFQSANNVSIGDMFQRTLAYSSIHPRVNLNKLPSIATVNAEALILGTYIQGTGSAEVTLNDNVVSPANLITISTIGFSSTTVKYKITRDNNFRYGELNVVSAGSGTLTWTDDYNESNDTGITLLVTEVGTNIYISYTSTSTGISGKFLYTRGAFYN